MTTDTPQVFGIRHLSPGGAAHVLRFLEQVQPTLVLVEGIADATPLIADLVDPRSRPPVAILAYTDSLPARTLVSPFAVYSPEYQALRWCAEHGVASRFIDLPSAHFLALQQAAQAPDDDTDDLADQTPGVRVSDYDRIAQAAGERDYESYWERRFEHRRADGAYREAANAFGAGLRELRGGDDRETLAREAYMRRCVQAAIAEGHEPGRIVVVVGAYHAPAIDPALPAMSDEELAALPATASKLTLMPYSYFKLSSQSGYGAGNRAPAYFERVWNLRGREPGAVAEDYLARVAREQREAGTHRSSASVIEAVRLARALSGLRDGHATVLEDLHDAATVLFGLGERGSIAEALARVDVGTAVGELAAGVSQTSIQHDFAGQLARLKLEAYRSKTVAQDLALDLRENRRVKDDFAAYLDLHRSRFLHRLQVLEIPFAQRQRPAKDAATWSERWVLHWTPEAEIALVEAVLLGESVEIACAHHLRGQLHACADIGSAAALVSVAGECDLPSLVDEARDRVQALACDSNAFVPLTRAAGEMGRVIRFGDLRQVDPVPLEPLLQQLFLQASLQLVDAAQCDRKTAGEMVEAIATLDRVGQEHHALCDNARWLHELHTLANRDDRNPLLSGYACALLCERGVIDDELLAQEVSRRLSPGISADLGAGWFEGLAQRNRYALLSRLALWRQLDAYISGLDDEEFARALVFLRRGFADFSPADRRAVAENLGQVWGVSSEAASEAIAEDLNPDEQQALDDLNDFDFEDF